jgi:hypothetical protein
MGPRHRPVVGIRLSQATGARGRAVGAGALLAIVSLVSSGSASSPGPDMSPGVGRCTPLSSLLEKTRAT